MQIGPSEAAVIISLVSVIVAIISSRRNAHNDTASDARNMATIVARLGSIQSSTDEIKTDVRQIKADIANHTERLMRLEIRMDALENGGK